MNETLFIILIYIAGAVPPALDVHSTLAWMRNPRIIESNKRFRLPNGKADIPKLIRWKLVFYAVAVIASLILWLYGAGWFSFLVIGVSAVIHLPTVIKNYRLARR